MSGNQGDKNLNKKKTIAEYFKSNKSDSKEEEENMQKKQDTTKKLKTNETKPVVKQQQQQQQKQLQSPQHDQKPQQSNSDTETETQLSQNSLNDQTQNNNIEKGNNQLNHKADSSNKIHQQEEEKKQNNDSNKSLDEQQKKTLRSQSKQYKNLQFYLNNLQSNPNGDLISNIHAKWRGNYKLLESHHGYVQWLFPNFYQSRFNSGSDPLQREEADEFIKNINIANRLKKSYDMIYEFFGMKIENEETGKVIRSKDYKERYQATFITSYHNHMRIRRILCHFNNVGFRAYSIALVDFLEKEIYGDIGFKKFSEDKRPIAIKWQEIPNTVPLRSLARLKVFEEWSIYGQIDETNQIIVETLQDNCFATIQDIKRQSVFFNKFKKQ